MVLISFSSVVSGSPHKSAFRFSNFEITSEWTKIAAASSVRNILILEMFLRLISVILITCKKSCVYGSCPPGYSYKKLTILYQINKV